MNFAKSYICFLLISIIPFYFFSQTIEKNLTVIIDPGHGGNDSGTLTKDGYLEKDINLYISKFIQLHINKYSPNINVILTREKDIFIPLQKRPLFGKIKNADLFISIHCNHNPNTKAEGLEIYIQKGINDSNLKKIKAQKFSNIVDSICRQKLNYKSRGIKYQNFSVLRNSINLFPSVLIELGFFSNHNDANYIISKKGINGLSLAISKSIITYFEK